MQTHAAVPQDSGWFCHRSRSHRGSLLLCARWELDSHHQKQQFAQNKVKSHAGMSGQAWFLRRTAHMQIAGLMSSACRTEDGGEKV
ncbi:uncharacterized [Tachysurus ichikawai]